MFNLYRKFGKIILKYRFLDNQLYAHKIFGDYIDIRSVARYTLEEVNCMLLIL